MITRKPFNEEPSEYSFFHQGASSGDRGASVAIISTLSKSAQAVLLATVIVALAFSVAAYVRSSATQDMLNVYRETMAAQKEALNARIAQASGEAAMAKQSADLLQYYVLDTDNKFVARGLLKPEETFSAKQQQRSK